MNIELWKKRYKELGFKNYGELAEKADVSKRSIEDIFRGFTKNPRTDTVEAIERALGIYTSRKIEKDPVIQDEVELQDYYTIPLLGSVVAGDIYTEMQNTKTERIFTQSYNAVRLAFKTLSQKLGFAVSAHILRHTYATRLEEAGISPKIQQYLLGHSKVDISQNIYTDAQSAYINSVSDKICAIFDTK